MGKPYKAGTPQGRVSEFLLFRVRIIFRKVGFVIAYNSRHKVAQAYLENMPVHASYVMLMKLVFPLR